MITDIDFPATEAYKRGEVPCPWYVAMVESSGYRGAVGDRAIEHAHSQCCPGASGKKDGYWVLVCALGDFLDETQSHCRERVWYQGFGYHFLSSFDSSDDAIAAMHEQFEKALRAQEDSDEVSTL